MIHIHSQVENYSLLGCNAALDRTQQETIRNTLLPASNGFLLELHFGYKDVNVMSL
jgi:hypothetical protein